MKPSPQGFLNPPRNAQPATDQDSVVYVERYWRGACIFKPITTSSVALQHIPDAADEPALIASRAPAARGLGQPAAAKPSLPKLTYKNGWVGSRMQYMVWWGLPRDIIRLIASWVHEPAFNSVLHPRTHLPILAWTDTVYACLVCGQKIRGWWNNGTSHPMTRPLSERMFLTLWMSWTDHDNGCLRCFPVCSSLCREVGDAKVGAVDEPWAGYPRKLPLDWMGQWLIAGAPRFLCDRERAWWGLE